MENNFTAPGDLSREQDFLRQKKEEKQSGFWQRTAVVVPVALFCCLLWGSASPSIKVGYRLFAIAADDTPSRMLFAGVRFMIAGLMVLFAGSVAAKKPLLPKKSTVPCIAVLALCQTVIQYIFFYMGLAHTSGVRTSIINATGTFFSIGLSVFLFHFEKLTAAKVAGSVLGFAGVFLIVTAGATLTGQPPTAAGEGALLLSTLSSAFAACFIKRFSAHEDPVTMSGWQFFFGGVVLSIIGASAGGCIRPSSGAAIALLIYMGFISAGAYTFWGILLKHNPVSRITVIGFMNPVFGVLLSALFLREGKEAFSPAGLAALALVSAGVIIVNRKPKKGGS